MRVLFLSRSKSAKREAEFDGLGSVTLAGRTDWRRPEILLGAAARLFDLSSYASHRRAWCADPPGYFANRLVWNQRLFAVEVAVRDG